MAIDWINILCNVLLTHFFFFFWNRNVQLSYFCPTSSQTVTKWVLSCPDLPSLTLWAESQIYVFQAQIFVANSIILHLFVRVFAVSRQRCCSGLSPPQKVGFTRSQLCGVGRAPSSTNNKQTNSVASVRERTIPTERPPPGRGVSRGQRNGSPRPLNSVF